MKAKRITKWATPFAADKLAKDQIKWIKATFKEVTLGKFLGLSVVLRRSLDLYAQILAEKDDTELRHEWQTLKRYAQGRQ